MRAGRSDLESITRRQRGEFAAKLDHLLARATRVAANFGPQFDDRLMHLRLDVLFQDHLAVRENFLNVRAQLTRLRIDDLKFFLDSKSEDVVARAHRCEIS